MRWLMRRRDIGAAVRAGDLLSFRARGRIENHARCLTAASGRQVALVGACAASSKTHGRRGGARRMGTGELSSRSSIRGPAENARVSHFKDMKVTFPHRWRADCKA